jgi:protocatechuate 3,4-dioxygenase beta subunit
MEEAETWASAVAGEIKKRCCLVWREPPAESPKSGADDPRPKPAAAKEAAKRPAAEDKDALIFGGRVIGPDGQPVAGARLYLTGCGGFHYEPFTAPESATTGRDGRFAFTAPKAKYPGQWSILAATAPNLAVGWVEMGVNDKKTDLTLKLVADDVPITGQIVDLEGKPVPGATLRVLQVMASPREDLGPWLEAAKDRTADKTPLPQGRSLALAQQYLPTWTTAPSAVVTTDAAGRFRLTGIGRERIVIVRLAAPTIASEYLHIRTRPGGPIRVGDVTDPEDGTRLDVTYYGSDFRHVAGPTRPVVGVVRDKDTKKPLAGFTICSEKLARNPVHGTRITETVTDAQGRYRLTGLPRGEGNQIHVVPSLDLPYEGPVLEVPDRFGPDPVTVDVELKRAVWIEGQLTDRATGKPVRGRVMYFVRDGNPNVGDYAGFIGGLDRAVETSEDGKYRILGLPGPGLITVFRNHQKVYVYGAEREGEEGLMEDVSMSQVNFAASVPINPAKGSESVRCNVEVVRGWTFTGTLRGPDGKPLVGAVMGNSSKKMETAEFTVRQFNPRRPRPLFFRHREKGLVGVAQPPKEDGGSVTVRMVPAAAVRGRLVDASGEPQAGVELRVSFRPNEEPHRHERWFLERTRTDQEGRFRIDALLPGLDYLLSPDESDVRFGSGLRAGQTKDLGDVR